MTLFASLINLIISIIEIVYPFILKGILVLWEFIKVWWWLFLPFLFFKKAKEFWLFKKNEDWSNNIKKILLEIKIPRETLKPVAAMENVLSGIWQTIYLSLPNWYEKWIEGQLLHSISLEIASFGGTPHFYMRIPTEARGAIEAAIFGQYPDAEIFEAEDYTKKVPQDMPNKDWDLFGADYKLLKGKGGDRAYPIKTYKFFALEEGPVEEKRVDPMAGLLEAMGKVGSDEQLWIQIVAKPIAEIYSESFMKQAEELRDKLAKRDEEEKEGSIIAPEMRLTPGEKVVLTALENKISSPLWQSHIRFILLGKRKTWFKGNLRLVFAFFKNFDGANLLIPRGGTLSKVGRKWYNFFWALKRRKFLLQRKIFRQYKKRLRFYFPGKEKKPEDPMILNSEELASLWHFPSSTVAPAPGIERVEVKRGGPPPQLPLEE